MSKINSTGYAYLQEWEDYITYGESRCTDRNYNAYKHTPSKEDCDKLCEELSGEVVSYRIDK